MRALFQDVKSETTTVHKDSMLKRIDKFLYMGYMWGLWSFDAGRVAYIEARNRIFNGTTNTYDS